ncbi:MAG: hypothetical protein ACLT1J_02095 [Mediterraneibacter gnavus]
MELNVENKKEAVVRKEIQKYFEGRKQRRRNVSTTGVEDQSGEAGNLLPCQQVGITGKCER